MRSLARIGLGALATVTFMKHTFANVFANSAGNVAVYWGQNSYGQSSGQYAQQTLATYCASTEIDIIPVAFLYQITTGIGGQPVVNLANQENPCTLFSGTGLINCPSIGAEITECQTKHKKTILLSIGGATYTEAGFSTPGAAIAGAELVWKTFGPAIDPTALRPFGDAVIDGFDFDFESTVNNIVMFGQHLRSLMDADTSKTYYLTAAPQCPYPDAADNDMLQGQVKFDAIFIQYYNNYCGVQSFVPGATDQWNFNFELWDDWAKNGSANQDVKLLLGVPAGQTAAGSGYMAPASLEPIVQYVKRFDSFGGVMMWDASQAYANDGFLAGVTSCLVSAGTKTIRSAEAVTGSAIENGGTSSNTDVGFRSRERLRTIEWRG